MQYITHYQSPLGDILLVADNKGLTGLWFEGGKNYANCLTTNHKESELEVLKETKRWLDIYFTGKDPEFMPEIHLIGSEFQMMVWNILLQIPYGKTVTYGEIAKEIAEKRNMDKMSAQAVGGAVGHNEIPILVPCHRVVGSGGSLTGYAGGMDKKTFLLQLEGVNTNDFTIPVKGTAVKSH